MSEYKPRPKGWTRCFICGESLLDDPEIIGGKVKGAGILCAHRKCFIKEQAERAEKEAESSGKAGKRNRAKTH